MKRLLLSLIVFFLVTGCSSPDSQKALGTLERDRVTFLATASEIIRALPVAEGVPVKAGQVLVRLDTQNQQAVLARAVAAKAKAEAYLSRLTNGERPEDIASAQALVTQAKAHFIAAEKTYTRKAELVEKRLVSQSEKDNALAVRDSARAALKSAEEKFSKLTAGARAEDIDQAKAELEAAKAEAILQKQKLDELTIVATRDGILDSLPYNLGERVPLNGIVAVIQANTTPYARVYVPAHYRVKFIPGQRVSVYVDDIDHAFEGTVRWISNSPSFTPYYALTENERSRLMYLAKIDLGETAIKLPSGVPAQVDLTEIRHD